jgi:hypothetical protein
MDGTYITHAADRKCVQDLRISERKTPFGRFSIDQRIILKYIAKT